MEEQLITLETAILAKEKSFDINCDWKIDKESKLHFQADLMYPNNSEFTFNSYDDPEVHEFNKFIESLYEAPTQSLLQKWLREVHGIYVNSYHDLTPDAKSIQYYTDWGFINDPSSADYKYCPNGGYDEEAIWKTYEEALENGLQEALKLIK